VGGESCFEGINLSLEIACFFLFRGGDASVEDDLAWGVCCFLGGDSEPCFKVLFVIPMGCSVSRTNPDESDLSLFTPEGQGGSRNAIMFASETRRDVVRGCQFLSFVKIFPFSDLEVCSSL